MDLGQTILASGKRPIRMMDGIDMLNVRTDKPELASVALITVFAALIASIETNFSKAFASTRAIGVRSATRDTILCTTKARSASISLKINCH